MVTHRFERGQRILQSYTNRPDVARDVVRAQESRTTFKNQVEPANAVERPRGSVTLDNNLYGRYMNELEITRRDLPADAAVNVLGHVIEDDLDCIQLIQSGTTFKLLTRKGMSNMDIRKLTTEQRNEKTMHLDELSTEEFVSIMNEEDRRVPDAIEKEKQVIAQVIDKVIAAFKKGGRLFYLGAGTSGRLGVLDAAECVPTFGVSRMKSSG